jgi:hypothetical protein
VGEGMNPHEIAVFVRSDAHLPRARDAVSKAGLKAVVFDANTDVRWERPLLRTSTLWIGLD